MQFQEVMRPRFKSVVEDATGRRVVGFMSGNQQDPDMICEVFVLAPTDLGDGLTFSCAPLIHETSYAAGASTNSSTSRSGPTWLLETNIVTRRPERRSTSEMNLSCIAAWKALRVS